MIVGINKRLDHDGTGYHIQAEDDGLEAAAFDLRVFAGGALLWAKRLAYGDLLDEALPRAEQESELRKRMERAVHTVEAAIRQGRLEHDEHRD